MTSREAEEHSTDDCRTLKEFLLTLIDERDAKHVQRMDATDKAISKAELAIEKRLESVNEFRHQMGDMQLTLVRKAEVDIRFESFEKRIEVLVAAGNKLVGQEKGIGMAWSIMTVVLSLVLSAVGVVVSLLLHH